MAKSGSSFKPGVSGNLVGRRWVTPQDDATTVQLWLTLEEQLTVRRHGGPDWVRNFADSLPPAPPLVSPSKIPKVAYNVRVTRAQRDKLRFYKHLLLIQIGVLREQERRAGRHTRPSETGGI